MTMTFSPQVSENTKHLLDRDGSFNYIKRENKHEQCGNMETYWLIGRNSIVARRPQPDPSAVIHGDPFTVTNVCNDTLTLGGTLSSGFPLPDQHHLLIHDPVKSFTMSRSGMMPKSSLTWQNGIYGSMEEEMEEDFGFDYLTQFSNSL